MRRAGRTSCDEYPFASTYEGGTALAAAQREIIWVKVNENTSQGGRITAWRGQMHVIVSIRSPCSLDRPCPALPARGLCPDCGPFTRIHSQPPPLFGVDYLILDHAEIYVGWSRHWEIAWLWFLS
ncbi:NucA/NucB deoxyribonuclease domain-containing protein [Streptomyces sp. f51]|uniref:NucA/NucB deoxyribonuclease domain-containing protein n=1 Tax=Streptomyces sp. f51 TaxID=1827742 RepID=UPI0030CADE6D